MGLRKIHDMRRATAAVGKKEDLARPDKRRASGEVHLRVGELQDFSQLVTLSESVYGFLPDGSCKDYYRWLYQENPTGRAITGNAASDGELVGHYALVPVPIWWEGHKMVAGLGVRSLTRRDFQGRGIFARLVTMVNEVAGRQGIQLTYVVPSPESHPWFIKMLGFEEKSQVSLWVRPLRFAPLIQFLPRWPRFMASVPRGLDFAIAPLLRTIVARRNPYGLEIRRVDEFGLEFDALWERAKRDFRFSAIRTNEHLRWRFGQGPTRDYRTWGAYAQGELVAYVVSRVRELWHYPGLNVGVIADLFGKADAIGVSGTRLLVAQALGWLYKRDISLCVMQLISPTFDAALRANGFFRVGQRFAGKRSLLFRSLDSRQTALPGCRDIHFAGGDHDMG